VLMMRASIFSWFRYKMIKFVINISKLLAVQCRHILRQISTSI